MANTLTGVIRITAPGAKESLAAVRTEVIKTETSLKSVGSTTIKAAGAFRNLANILPGIGIAGLIGGLASLVSGLFNSASAFDKASLSAEIFKDKLDDLKEASDRLKGFLELQNALADLNFRITGGEGAAAKINNLQNQFKSTGVIIKDAAKNLEIFNAKEIELIENAKQVSQALALAGKKNPLVELALAGKDLSKITKAEAEKMPGALKVITNAFIDNRKAIEAADKTYTEAVGEQVKIRKQIQLTEVEEQKRLFELSVKDNEKYVREIIAFAKKYSSFFKDNIDITPGFSIFDSIKDEFEKSKKFLEKFNTGQFKIKLLVNAEMSFPPEQVKPVATDFGVMFQKELNGYFNKSDPTDFGLQDFINNQAEFFSNANPDIIGVELQAFLIKAYAGAKNKAVLINAATELANSFNDALQSGLRNSLFAIGEDIGDIFSGKNPAGAFINVISGMLQQIGAALIAFGTAGVVFKEILADLVKFFVTNPAIAIAAGVAAVAAGQLLKNSISGARALGGPVSSGGTYLVGERGPELFRPNTGGAIIPNNQLGGRGAFMGGGMQFQIVGTNVIRGKDLVQIFTLQQLSNNRLV